MVLTKVPGTLIPDDAITSAKILDATIVSADIANTTITSGNMALDPRNATNLSSGSVPLAQLGNAPEYDDSALLNDIATLALHSAIQNNQTAYNLTNAFIDQFEDSSGIDVLTDCQRNTTGEYVASTVDTTETYHPNADGVATWIDTPGSVSGTNNTLFTTGSTGSGGNALMNDQSGKITGIFTLITELTQKAGGPAPYIAGYGVSKNIDTLVNYNGNANSAYPAAPASFNLSSSIGDKIKIVYDTANEDVITNYKDTGSGYGSAGTAVNSVGANFLSTTLVTPYFFLVGWSDSGTPWKVTCTGTREYGTANATGNYTSTTETAIGTVSKMSIVVLYKNAYGTATLDADLVAQVSANGGTNYTPAPLTAAGTFSTGILMAKSNDITISNTGTAPKYKISFANQADASKETRVYGVALLY